ncbi:MAG: HIT family protein [Phycisphaerae bacterium]|nr:HIT family protein [Phycisphaerae bacterium]
MFDAKRWSQKVAGQDCPVCAATPEAEDPLWLVTLPSGRVLLQDDADFPGYCILYFRRHVTELFELTTGEQGQLIEDIGRLARAISGTCRPAKLNYACLGNEVPHLHWHVVPRYPEDGWWGQAFLARSPAQRKILEPGKYERLRRGLRATLG